MSEKLERDFKGIWIPKEIWLSNNLTLHEKLFLVEIDSLDNDNGCFASNAHFMDFFGLSKNRCSEIIKSLEKKGYLKIEYIREKGKSNIKQRIIKRVFEISNRGIRDFDRPIRDFEGGIRKTGKGVIHINNTIINRVLCSTQEIIEKWNELDLQHVRFIKANTTRKKLLDARAKEYGQDAIIQAIENIKESDFLKGQNPSGWQITFDWFIKPNNFVKVLEGNYKNKPKGENKQVSKNKFHNFSGHASYSEAELEEKLGIR